MNCPYCNNLETKVVDSRESKDGSTIKRRRECLECEKRFSTIERILKLDMEVEKSNGDIEVFNLQKIKTSLLKACEKRPITLEQIEDILKNILNDLKKVTSSKISTSIVGSIVLKNLKDVDEISFLKFAIIHNHYNSINEFTKEFNSLKSYKGIDYKSFQNNKIRIDKNV